jgi:hypothetical protein
MADDAQVSILRIFQIIRFAPPCPVIFRTEVHHPPSTRILLITALSYSMSTLSKAPMLVRLRLFQCNVRP